MDNRKQVVMEYMLEEEIITSQQTGRPISNKAMEIADRAYRLGKLFREEPPPLEELHRLKKGEKRKDKRL